MMTDAAPTAPEGKTTRAQGAPTSCLSPCWEVPAVNAWVTFTVTWERSRVRTRSSVSSSCHGSPWELEPDGEQPANHLPPVTGTPKGQPHPRNVPSDTLIDRDGEAGKTTKAGGLGLPSAGGTALLLRQRQQQWRPHTQTTCGSSLRSASLQGRCRSRGGGRAPPVSDPGTNAPPGSRAPPSHVSLASSPLTTRSRTQHS